jgi:hypothetical protein
MASFATTRTTDESDGTFPQLPELQTSQMARSHNYPNYRRVLKHLQPFNRNKGAESCTSLNIKSCSGLHARSTEWQRRTDLPFKLVTATAELTIVLRSWSVSAFRKTTAKKRRLASLCLSVCMEERDFFLTDFVGT